MRRKRQDVRAERFHGYVSCQQPVKYVEAFAMSCLRNAVQYTWGLLQVEGGGTFSWGI